jgi:hypothetical protein
MQEVVELLKAHSWFAASVALAPILLRLFKAKESKLFEVLPESLKFLPATVIVYLAAFIESAASGDGWEAAALNALVLTVIGAPMSVGGYHMAKKATPAPKPPSDPPGPEVRRATLGTIFALALGAPLALARCAAVPVAAAWLPAVLTALSAAGTLLEQVRHWVDRFRGVIPVEIAAKIDAYLNAARAALEQTKALVGKGQEFQAEAEKAYQLLRGLLDKLFAELAGVGLYESSSERLTAPPTMRAIEGKIQEVESMVVSMPPESLQ